MIWAVAELVFDPTFTQRLISHDRKMESESKVLNKVAFVT